MLDVRTYLDIVEVRLVNHRGDTNATTVPGYMKLRMILVDVLSQHVDSLRVSITTHKGNTSNVRAILADEIIDGIVIQGKSDVVPEIMAMAPGTMTRAIRDINCQCHLVRYLLEDNACIYIFKHDECVGKSLSFHFSA